VTTAPWPANEWTNAQGVLQGPPSSGSILEVTPARFGPANPGITRNGSGPPGSTQNPEQLTAPAGVSQPRSYPYLVDNFFYTAAPEYPYPVPTVGATALSPPYIGGPSGAGWHKMLSFFEVPSPSIGATGMVAQGNNFDWFRQDTKPGLLNINLIIDEEVFLGLMGMDTSDSYQQAVMNAANGAQTRLQLNMAPVLNNAATPAIVTQLNAAGYPNAAVQMPNLGAFSVTAANGNGTSNLKGSFVDFLRLRSGGVNAYDVAGNSYANFLYGLVGGVPVDRPFHSLSYPDINYTAMRPAYPPPPPPPATPPGTTYPFANPIPSGPVGTGVWPAGSYPFAGYIQDPGVMNPYLAAASLPVQVPPIQPPPIPARRLFQIPDAYGSPTPGNLNQNLAQLSNNGTVQPPFSVTLPTGVTFSPVLPVASPGSTPASTAI
jgi:hypothetical protein